MPPKRAPGRGPDGRFLSDLSHSEEGFLSDIARFSRLAYKLWRFVPLILVFMLLWYILGISNKLLELKSDVCSCLPPTAPNGSEKLKPNASNGTENPKKDDFK